MISRAFSVHPGSVVSNVDDRSAVIVGSGVLAFGLTVAEGRQLARQIAVACDDVEAQLSKREYVVTRRNPADTCGCGAASVHTDVRNGQAIGLCDDCK